MRSSDPRRPPLLFPEEQSPVNQRGWEGGAFGASSRHSPARFSYTGQGNRRAVPEPTKMQRSARAVGPGCRDGLVPQVLLCCFPQKGSGR